ncbi:MAG: GGDEF domain-containing protein [Acidobacteriota bacterium]
MARRSRLFTLLDVLQLPAGLLLWAALLLFPATRDVTLGSTSLPIPALEPFGGAGPVILVGVLLAGSLVANRYKFAMNTGSFFVSFDISFAMAAFFLVSPLSGMALAFATTLADCLQRFRAGALRPPKLYRMFASMAGNRLLRLGASFACFYAITGDRPFTGSARDFVAGFAAFGVYYLANNLAFLPLELEARGDLRGYLREALKDDLPYSFAILALGFVMSLVALQVGLAAFLLTASFIVAATMGLSALTRAQRDLRGKVEDLTILSRVSAAASSDLDLMPMVESFTRSLARHLPADGIGVIFYQRYATTIYLVQVEGEKSRSTYLPEERRFQYDQLPLSEPSQKLGERLFEFLQPLETAPFLIPPSVFGLPLLHGGEPFGGIVVYSYQADVPLSDKRELLELCAQSLVVGLENCFLHLQAIQDPLTGLYNRSYFLYRLQEELSFSARHRAPFALMMVDLDDFKAVNDHLGHASGDTVLRRIGDLLRRETRREDVPARYGGDEFILLLLGCRRDAALEKAKKLRSLIGSKALPKEEAQGLTIGCSTGILHSDDLKGEQDLPTLLRRLDEALYRAKQAGKNRIEWSE